MKRNTKSALLLSVVSIIVCCTMLLGTTMAWFTDSVTSSKNVIVAGNLDVELYHTNPTKTDELVDGTTDLFFTDIKGEEILWEPGVVSYEVFTVKNVGNLALKYALSMNVYDATATADGKTLEDVIKVAIATAVPETRADVENLEFEALSDFEVKSNGSLVPDKADTEDVEGVEEFIVVLYWEPSENDNDYNMNNENKGTVLDIEFAVELFATQYTYEEDSFDDQYDAAAPWTGEVSYDWYYDAERTEEDPYVLNSAEDLAGFANIVNGTAVSSATTFSTEVTTIQDSFAGKTVKLGANIDLNNIAWTPIGNGNNVFAGTFDGNGYTISNLNISSATSAGFFANVRSSVTIKNVTFDNANVSGTHYVAVILAGEWNENASATIDNCTVINSTVTCDTDAANDNGDKVGGICGYAVSLNITNCTVKDTTIKAYRDFGGIIGCANANKVVVTGNTVENLTLIIDNEVNYQNYTTNEEHNANPIVGRVSNAEVKDNTATDCKVGREVYGLQLFTTGDSTVHGNIIVSDKEGLLNLTKLADNWVELFSNGQGTGYGNYMTQNGGAGGDYYYCWTWNIELTSDIDLGGATIDPIRLDLWGSFNGNDHTISNAKIVTDSTTENGAGLFSASYCSMKNIKLDNIHVTGSNVGNSTAGVLADSCNKDQGIENITITNSSVTGGKYTGGVVGYGYTDIINCTLTNVTVKGGYKMGGLIGYICASSGNGDVTGNTLIDCTVDGIGNDVYAGGKDKYVIGKVVGNYNCNGTCNDNTITNMTTSAIANIGEIEDNKTVTE